MSYPLVTFGLAQAIIASRLGAGSYGDGIDIPNVNMMNATLRVLSVEGTGNDRIVAAPARIIAGRVHVRMTSVPFTVLEVIYGISIVTFGADDTLVESLPIYPGQRLPWWGVVGQGLEEEGLGDMLIQGSKCKIASDVQLGSMEYGVISSMEFDATCLGDADEPILVLQNRATAGDLDLPLAHIS